MFRRREEVRKWLYDVIDTFRQKGATKPGRIPGVTWIEWKDVLIEEGPYKGYWKPAEDIKKIFASKGVTPDKDIYIY